ncbi:MAG TPA: aspartate aminotransferase family protein [Deltaproteobacteria bacterium]|nr:aspartate aminotransferase family protein [Deltaproteobacteria bacterium]
MKTTDLMNMAERVFSKGLVNVMRETGHDFLEAERSGSYVFDSEGNRYLDGYTSAGTFNLGRKNPAITAQLKKMVYKTDQGNFVMPSKEKTLLARRLSEFVPGELECVLYGVTRGESMDAACKLARGYTGRPGLVTVDGGYYGETGFALSLSSRESKEQFGSLIPEVTVIPFGDIDAASACMSLKPAAFIMEPIQTENHCRTADSNYYSRIRELCARNGVQLIFDETSSGFGRTGKKFFFEYHHVLPDILILGEAITSGMFPMTAMVFTPELKTFFDAHPLIHLCTFGGHDLGCHAAITALDEYELTAAWENAANLGELLLGELADAALRDQSVVSVTGKGLLISMMFSSQATALNFCKKARAHGLLVNTARVATQCVLLMPSLLITAQEKDQIVTAVKQALEDLKPSQSKVRPRTKKRGKPATGKQK